MSSNDSKIPIPSPPSGERVRVRGLRRTRTAEARDFARHLRKNPRTPSSGFGVCCATVDLKISSFVVSIPMAFTFSIFIAPTQSWRLNWMAAVTTFPTNEQGMTCAINFSSQKESKCCVFGIINCAVNWKPSVSKSGMN